MFCDLSPIQFDLSDLHSELLIDAKKQISNTQSVRNYQQESDRIEKIKNFKKLNELFYPDLPRCNFSVYEISPHIEIRLKEKFKILEDLSVQAYYRYQMVSGAGVLLPHRDENRKSSIVILLCGEGESEFYDEDDRSYSIFPDPDKIKLSYSCKMNVGESWVYNHHSIHSVKISTSPRIAFSLGFDDIYADKLYDYIKSKSLRIN
jgi:hypothetical protein